MRTLVLDDDPTGTQAVHDVRVLLRWPDEALAEALADGAASVHLMTNSRALRPAAAHELTADAARIAARYGRVVLRGDSTLRGHFLEEHPAVDPDIRSVALLVPAPIGNVHGTYSAPPVLDWERLDAVRAVVAAPLSLHGASGLTVEDLRRAVSGGIAKVNVNTELREAWFAAALDHLGALAGGARLLRLQQELGAAVAAVADQKLEAVEGAVANKESPIP